MKSTYTCFRSNLFIINIFVDLMHLARIMHKNLCVENERKKRSHETKQAHHQRMAFQYKGCSFLPAGKSPPSFFGSHPQPLFADYSRPFLLLEITS